MCVNIQLEENADWHSILQAMKMIRGVLSVRRLPEKKRKTNDSVITPELAERIREARENYLKGDTVCFNSMEEFDKYFESI